MSDGVRTIYPPADAQAQIFTDPELSVPHHARCKLFVMDSFARDAVYDMIIVLSVTSSYCIFYSFILIKMTTSVYIDFKFIELAKRHYIKKRPRTQS